MWGRANSESDVGKRLCTLNIWTEAFKANNPLISTIAIPSHEAVQALRLIHKDEYKREEVRVNEFCVNVLVLATTT